MKQNEKKRKKEIEKIMESRKRDERAIHFGLELHRSAQCAIIHTIEELLNFHPYHVYSRQKNFPHALMSACLSMRGTIHEILSNPSKYCWENGRVCVQLTPPEKKKGKKK